jgi:hypothetical protein
MNNQDEVNWTAQNNIHLLELIYDGSHRELRQPRASGQIEYIYSHNA